MQRRIGFKQGEKKKSLFSQFIVGLNAHQHTRHSVCLQQTHHLMQNHLNPSICDHLLADFIKKSKQRLDRRRSCLMWEKYWNYTSWCNFLQSPTFIEAAITKMKRVELPGWSIGSKHIRRSRSWRGPHESALGTFVCEPPVIMASSL